VTVVVAGTVPEIEIAVRLALLTGFAPNPGEQLLSLVVVARSEALGIIVVDEAIVVIIRAVATGRDASVALDEEAQSRATVRRRDDHRTILDHANAIDIAIAIAGRRRTVDKDDAAGTTDAVAVVSARVAVASARKEDDE